MKRLNRQWMYERLDAFKKPNVDYKKGVLEFLEIAKQNAVLNNRPDEIKCPCAKCDNRAYLPEPEVRNHLYSKGFCKNYYTWTFHGEILPRASTSSDIVQNPYIELVEHALRPVIDQIMEDRLNPDDIPDEEITSEAPNLTVASFFKMLRNAEQPLYEGSKVCLLEAASRLLTLKCEYNLSMKCVDAIASLISDIIPKDNNMSRNFYNIKKGTDSRTPHGLLCKSKKNKKGEWITPRAEQIDAEYERLRQLHDPDGQMTEDAFETYLQAVGGFDKKTRVFGLGNVAKELFVPPTTSSRSSTSSQSSYTPSLISQYATKNQELEMRLSQLQTEYATDKERAQEDRRRHRAMEAKLAEQFGWSFDEPESRDDL
ncbi:hypothetical protein OROHE_022833 [Orobanche hederae]